jgi:AraC-like DNA-binding protein
MGLNAHTLITVLQALQLAALLPCLFVVAFLLLTARKRVMVIVPCLYFLALAASFLLPLLDIWSQWTLHSKDGRLLTGGLMFAQSLLPALSFLLVMQFANGRVPSLWHWLVLALPLIGGGGVVYAALLADEICLANWGCMAPSDIEAVYASLGNALIFLLLMAIFIRTRAQPNESRRISPSEYRLIVALIVLNLLSLAVALLRVHGTFSDADALFLHTMLRITFIYVGLTLLARVFDTSVSATQDEEKAANPAQEEKDRQVVEGFEQLMEERHMYREMECSRESVAKELGVSENVLSRIINQHYQARFTDVVNQYRLKEAQRMLVANPQQAVTDIAFEVGFNSIPSFNRVFKDNTGFSPTAFRATRLQGRKTRS